MELVQVIALIIFFATIVVILLNIVDRALAAMAGVGAMVLFGIISLDEAVSFVDWSIMGLLLGVWIIAGYFGKTGVPELLAAITVKRSKADAANFLILISFLAAIISMFLDNVVVVLMMAPVIFSACKALKVNPIPFILFMALAANLEGTALLIGDLPPMMLASVAEIGFLDFFISQGRPAAFPILMLTTLVLMAVFWVYFRRKFLAEGIASGIATLEHTIENKSYAIITCSVFLGTVLCLAARELIGLPLGVIGLCGAVLLAIILRRGFEEALGEVDWRAVFFYLSLFVLVGALDKVGIIEMIADALMAAVNAGQLIGVSAIYWSSAPICAFIEHDAYILIMLHSIKTMATLYGINPFPLWWSLVLAGTLGSNFTMMGAPALLVALNICEREGYKVSLREFFKMTIPFALVSLFLCYILTLIFWVFL